MNFKNYLLTLFLISFLVSSLSAQNLNDSTLFDFNQKRFALQQDLPQQSESYDYSVENKKSPVKAALLSAVVPGAGEAYAKSYWKAAAFFIAEVTIWTVYVTYDNKGQKEDDKMRAFGNEHWSEQLYWSNVYNAAIAGDYWDAPELNPEDGLLPQSEIDANISYFRSIESDYGTHSLPHTHTQQYYEMIYKYPHQFGDAWDDVDALREILGDENFTFHSAADYVKLTPNMSTYRDMRDRTEEYYQVATNMSMIAMVNHLASLFDAAITVKKYNKKIDYAFRMQPQYDGYSYTNTYGVNISW